MKKIPTLFERIYNDHRVVGITDDITPGCELAFHQGIATIKIDGSCCAIIGNKFYKRYDAKKGKKPPVRAIPCCDPDPVTGHWPHWVEITDNPSDKWFIDAMKNAMSRTDQILDDGTYEAVGPHFNGNPYHISEDILIKHGAHHTIVDRNFESIREWLKNNYHEGIVFWLNGEPVCKIKRTDFGLTWGSKK